MVSAGRLQRRAQALREHMAATDSAEHRMGVALKYLSNSMSYARKERAVTDDDMDALADELIGYLLEQSGMVESATPDAPCERVKAGIRRGGPAGVDAHAHAREDSNP